MDIHDTIIAPATAYGGSLSIIRMSGQKVQGTIKKLFRPATHLTEFVSHHFYYGHIVDRQQHKIDEVMLVYMAGPHSYTTEDVAEIHCHGSPQITKSILGLFCAEGLRLAQPGEFTYRAFYHGRIDLSQAEAVSQLINAQSEFSRKLSLSQLEGSISRFVYQLTDQIKQALVFIESWIDFPEEDIPQSDLDPIFALVTDSLVRIDDVCNTYDYGRVMQQGAAILIVGKTNSGKSSLLNFFLDEDRSIVTDMPGTTRDFIEEGLTINGLPVRMIDTAGLRDTDNPVELEGIRRAENKLEQADLILFLKDASVPYDDQDDYVYRRCRSFPAFFVLTKADLPGAEQDLSFVDLPHFSISVKKGSGVEQLRQAIYSFLCQDYQSDQSVVLTQQRHYDALLAAQQSLNRFLSLAEESSPLDLCAFELREALYALGTISGHTTSESLLDDIFSQFCIGK